MSRFARSIWKISMTASAALMALALDCSLRSSLAEDTAEQLPTVITMELAATPTPSPAPRMKLAYREYPHDQATIDALASVYWAECNTDRETLAVTQLLKNRADYGAPFSGSIYGAAMQGQEFNRGRISDRNRDLARVNLNRVLTQAAGDYAGIDVPRSAVYMRRDGGQLVMLDDQWDVVWRCG